MNLVGKFVKVYDGDLIGWTTGKIVKDFGNGRVKIHTREDYELTRIISNNKQLEKDGSAYLINISKLKKGE
mgnify:CR=1 FL=1